MTVTGIVMLVVMYILAMILVIFDILFVVIDRAMIGVINRGRSPKLIRFYSKIHNFLNPKED